MNLINETYIDIYICVCVCVCIVTVRSKTPPGGILCIHPALNTADFTSV